MAIHAKSSNSEKSRNISFSSSLSIFKDSSWISIITVRAPFSLIFIYLKFSGILLCQCEFNKLYCSQFCGHPGWAIRWVPRKLNQQADHLLAQWAASRQLSGNIDPNCIPLHILSCDSEQCFCLVVLIYCFY